MIATTLSGNKLNHHFFNVISFEFTPYRLNHIVLSFHPWMTTESEEVGKCPRAGVCLFRQDRLDGND